MSTTKYKASYGSIESVKVEKETAAAVWIKGWTFNGGAGTGELRKHLKRTERESYFDTWDEAKAHLLMLAEASVLGARERLKRANDHLGNVKGLKPPKAAA